MDTNQKVYEVAWIKKKIIICGYHKIETSQANKNITCSKSNQIKSNQAQVSLSASVCVVTQSILQFFGASVKDSTN